jgi:hypothetical protein
MLAENLPRAIFCHRTKQKLETLHWYADLMNSAKRILCMTFAFNLEDVFRKVLVSPGKTLRYAVFDKSIKTNVTWQARLGLERRAEPGPKGQKNTRHLWE